MMAIVINEKETCLVFMAGENLSGTYKISNYDINPPFAAPSGAVFYAIYLNKSGKNIG